MRFWFGGPRIMGVRPGVIFGPEDFRAFRDPEKASPSSSPDASVYVITSGVGLCKIGISNQPNLRVAQLQTGNGEPLRLAFALPVPNGHAANVEAMAHRTLAGERRAGEWFAVPELKACAAVVAAAQYYGVTVEMTDAKTGETLTAMAVDRKPRMGLGWRILGLFAMMFGAITLTENAIHDPYSAAPIHAAIVAGLIWWFFT